MIIAPMIVKTAFVVGTAGEIIVLALAQTTTVDTTAVWVAAIGFGGLIGTSVLTFIGQRAAANDQREANRELRAVASRSVEKIGEVHTLVNSRGEKQDKIIEELTAELRQKNAEALAKAEAAPPIVHPNTESK